MKRGLLTFVLLFFLSFTAWGNTHSSTIRRFTFGAEWSYCATLFSGINNYFYAPEGFRVNQKESILHYISNGETSINAGYNLNNNWNLSLHLGYTKIGKYHAAIPVSLRATRYFEDNHLSDKWFTFIDLGSGVSLKTHPQEILTGKIGAGYRLSLSRYTKLDLLMSIRGMYTHPDVKYYGEIIDKTVIKSNEAFVCSLSLGIGLNF